MTASVLRSRPVLLAGGAILAVALAAASGGELATGTVRALAVVTILGLAALAARPRSRSADGRVRSALSIDDRKPLGRDSGVAIVTAGGRRFLVGYGAEGVRPLAELTPPQDGGRP